MMWGGGYGFSAGMVIWAILALAVLVLIAIGVLFLVRGAGGRGDQGHAGPTQVPPAGSSEARTPLRILEERYAGGEIEREEFLRRKSDLLGG